MTPTVIEYQIVTKQVTQTQREIYSGSFKKLLAKSRLFLCEQKL